jgi:hypothetical protein
MARAIRWQGTFKSLSNKTCTVSIYDEGWSGGITTLTFAADPVVIEEDNSSDLLNVVRIKTGYLQVIEQSYGDLADLYPQTSTEHYITITYNGATVFVGYLQAQSFDQEYASGPRVISIPFTSPLGVAGGLWMPTPSAPSYKTLASALKDAIDTLNAGIDTVVFPDYMLSNSERVLALRTNTLAYCPFNDEYNIKVGSDQTLYNPKTVEEFIEDLCNCFGLMVHDLGTEIIFTRFDYTGYYNQYVVNTMGSSSPSYRAITDGSTVQTINAAPTSNESETSTILPNNVVEIDYNDEVNPSYELPYNRSKAHTYGDNWVLLTPSTDEITSPYMATNQMPTTTSNNVAVCATNGSKEDSSFKEMIMFSRVSNGNELFTWKLYNIPKYAAHGCKISFSLKAVTWQQVEGKYYYDTAEAKAKPIGVRIKNGSLYFQSNGTWAAAPDVIYRNTGGSAGDSDKWMLTIWTAMNSITDPLEITFFSGDIGTTGLYAIEDLVIEPIQKGIVSYVTVDNSESVKLKSANGAKNETSVSQSINVKRRSEYALVNTSGGFYEVLACSYTYMFLTQYRLDYDTFIVPSDIYYLNKIKIGSNDIRRRVIGFKFDLWNEKVTIMAQGSSTL